MPGTYTGMVITRDNYIAESRLILYTFIEYYAHSATILTDGLAAWGANVTVNAKPTEDGITPGDLLDKVHISIDRAMPMGNTHGAHPDVSGLDESCSWRLNLAITMTTHRRSVNLLDDIVAKFNDLIVNHHSELAAVEVRRLRVTRPFMPVIADANPSRVTYAMLLEYEVTFLSHNHHG